MTKVPWTSRRGVLALPLALAASRAAAQPNLRPARTRLIGGSPEGADLWAGVEIALAAGWKTYWRVAGDSGIPPRFDFTGSTNLAAAEVLYPAPERLSDGFGEILGYSRDVVFPVRVRPSLATAPVRLALKLDYGVCERLCVPMQAEMQAELGAASPPPADLSRLALALARVPRRSAAGTAVREVVFDRAEGRLSVLAALASGGVRHIVVEGAGERPLPLPELARLGDGGMRATLRIEPPAPAELVVTVVGETEAVEERRSLDG